MFPRPVSSNEERILTTFTKELNTLLQMPDDMERTIGIMEKLLAGEPVQIPTEDRALVEKVGSLQGMMNRPDVSSVNTIAIKTLRGKMQGMLASKIDQLKELKSCKELVQVMISELSPDGAQFLITTVEGFYLKGLSDNLFPEKALTFALAKGMIASFINEPDINKNTALRRALERDNELQDYICIFKADFVGSDAVFLHREGRDDNSLQRYHRVEIERYVQSEKKDPVTRAPRTLDDIKEDFEASQVIGRKAGPWLEPRMKDLPFSFEVRVLMNKGLLLCLGAAYSIIKEEYEPVVKKTDEINKAIEKLEVFGEEVVGQIAFLAAGINPYVEQIPPPCYSCVKEFIKHAVVKTKTEGLSEVVKSGLNEKVHVLISFFYRIEQSPLPLSLKEEILAAVGNAIKEEKPLDQIEALFLEYMNSVEFENRLREECPGCLIGGKEWACLGIVEKAPPLTEKILQALHEPSPSDPAKKAWQTGILVLVPEIVDGKSLTLNRLGELVKKDFPDTETGYRRMNRYVCQYYGEIPMGKSRWVLIEKDILPESRGKGLQESEDMVKPPYERPELVPMLVGIILNYLNSENKERLFGDSPWTYIPCKEKGISGHSVFVGGFNSTGILFFEPQGAVRSNQFGFGAQRNFDSRLSTF